MARKKDKIVTERWIMTFPENEIRNPVLNDISKKFPKFVVNLMGASILPAMKGDELFGVMTIEITGKESKMREAKYYLAEKRKIKIEFSVI